MSMDCVTLREEVVVEVSQVIHVEASATSLVGAMGNNETSPVIAGSRFGRSDADCTRCPRCRACGLGHPAVSGVVPDSFCDSTLCRTFRDTKFAIRSLISV